jgi:hypothetical protein
MMKHVPLGDIAPEECYHLILVTIDGFGLVIGFIAHFDTARDYNLQFTITLTLVSTVSLSLLLLGSGFQWGGGVPVPLGF